MTFAEAPLRLDEVPGLVPLLCTDKMAEASLPDVSTAQLLQPGTIIVLGEAWACRTDDQISAVFRAVESIEIRTPAPDSVRALQCPPGSLSSADCTPSKEAALVRIHTIDVPLEAVFHEADIKMHRIPSEAESASICT